MPSELSIALHKLHSLLTELEDVEGSLAHGPRRIAAAERKLQASKDEVEVQKQTIKDCRKTADEGNLKLRTREADLRKIEGQLNQASSNKEYDIFKGQIASAKQDLATLEDAALAAMEALDVSQAHLKTVESGVIDAQKHLETVQKEVAAAESGLRQQLDELREKVAAAEKTIKWGEHSAAYARLRGAHGAAALASVEDQCCTACNNRITSQDVVRINTDVLIACRECGRLIYLL
ncbi:MAG: hypothetical protein KDA91_23290 [Planctomycetaceae bacterium]|nr:hypothetical protein [Planctomycetaceae bacterium]